MATYDYIIIGGGIVGLATALNILEKKEGAKLALIEKEDQVAKHQTGHNSGVIHSGIYYKPGSLKAENCKNGYHKLLDFCQKNDIKHELCGKVIVATDQSEFQALQNIYDRGVANGLDGIKMIGKEELKEHEPHVNGLKAIYVPQAGIIDYKEVAETYAKRIKELGGEIFLNEKVVKMEDKDGVVIHTKNKTYYSKFAINCAGLYSDKVARMNQDKVDLKIIPFRGEYYELKKEKEYLVNNLIYPVPNPNFPFLGVHFTRMINGGIEAGPNAVLAYAREGYTKGKVNMAEFFESLFWPGFQKVAWKYWRVGFGEMYRSYSKAAFTKALQKLMPEITTKDLIPGGAGVRAQACDRKGGLLDDFKIIDGKNVINVCNAPSPAATSSLAIGESIADLALAK